MSWLDDDEEEGGGGGSGQGHHDDNQTDYGTPIQSIPNQGRLHSHSALSPPSSDDGSHGDDDNAGGNYFGTSYSVGQSGTQYDDQPSRPIQQPIGRQFSNTFVRRHPRNGHTPNEQLASDASWQGLSTEAHAGESTSSNSTYYDYQEPYAQYQPMMGISYASSSESGYGYQESYSGPRQIDSVHIINHSFKLWGNTPPPSHNFYCW